MKNLVVLYLIYGNENLDDGLIEIDRIVNKMFENINKKYVIIDNSNTHQVITVDDKHYIHGNNDYFDFSGWDEGFKYARENFIIDEKTMFLFVNDTFFQRNYSDGENFLDVFDKSILKDKDLNDLAIGYIDDFPKNVVLNGINYNSWIRSNIFFLSSNVMKKIEKLTFNFPKNRIFSNDINEFWSKDNLISDNWKAYISSWLFGKEDDRFPEYKLHWLKAKPLNEDTWDFFQRKAITILSEHYLTARLFDMNIEIIDTNIFPKDPLRHIKPYYKEQE